MGQEKVKCIFCGGDLCWDSDEKENDMFVEYGDDDEAILSYYHCMKCGRSYEIADPTKEEKETEYKDYWK